MMELSHSLTLNEEALLQIPENKRPVFIFEWLRFLDKVLGAAQKSDIKGCQRKLVDQLVRQVTESPPGLPSRLLIGRCLATLFLVGDASLLFDTINTFNDIMKNKDDSPSYLPVKLASVSAMGSMYEQLGRMMGRSYEETVSILLKSLKNAESQMRCEILTTFQKIVSGVGSAAAATHRDIFKALRHCLTDRVMAVRCKAAKCLQEMVPHSSFMYTTDLETAASLCFRSLEGSNYEVRCAISGLLGALIAATQQTNPSTVTKGKLPSMEEAFNLLASGFLRGGIGFLKTGPGEMIKGGSTVSREVRVGVTHAYVVACTNLGRTWLENHLPFLLSHLLEVISSPRASATHVEAVHSRKCVAFILRTLLGQHLGEQAQAAACRDLVGLMIRHINEDTVTKEDSVEGVSCSQHVVVCALDILGWLLEKLNTLAASIVCDSSTGIVETILSVLAHPSPACRLAAAQCLHRLSLAVPSQLCPLLDKAGERLEAYKASGDAISGYSAAFAALLGAARFTPLGIPHNRGKIIFNVAEDLLRSASQNSRLSLQRTQAGWLTIGAVMSLGPSVVRGLLPRMLLLWKNSFPRSSKELDSEKKRGDAFTWQLTLEGRSGALAAISSFLQFCKELVTEEVVRRILSPVESALIMLINLGPVTKSYGQHLKASVAMVRLRLYEVLLLLPPNAYEGSYNNLLRLLVSEFTLTENPANTTTSLLRSLCHSNDSIILGFWLQDTDHQPIEAQLQPNSASGSGALEHDATALYKSHQKSEALPLGVAVIDASVILFGTVFPQVAIKHRFQMLEHFGECVRHSKASRQEAVQINIFTAVLHALKALVENKGTLGPDDIKNAAIKLILNSLNHSNPILRCAAGEALGRMAQVMSDGRFVAEMAQQSFDKLRTARDAATRTGNSLALGCLHRYVGGMGSGQHLNTSVSILLALAQDANAPVVQVWALHALAMIADSGGPLFRGYAEPTLSLCLQLSLGVSGGPTADVAQCIGRLTAALITTLGPELGSGGTAGLALSSILAICAALQNRPPPDPLARAEAVACLQQLHMFAPRQVNLATLVPELCRSLQDPHLLLRRAAVACLRQLAQREAGEVSQLATQELSSIEENAQSLSLESTLFGMLDTEIDDVLVSNIHDTLTSMLQSLAADNVKHWISLCKSVLTATDSTASSQSQPELSLADHDDEDDEIKIAEAPASSAGKVAPRWRTRVFAAQSLQRIIVACEGTSPAHFDLSLAREKKLKEGFLVCHLSDLVRMSFIAATSESDALRVEGLKTLQMVIDKFSKIPEPEFPGHVILEQYQAQVGAALRPAFSSESPSHITAIACQVSSSWISSHVARELSDLRRIHQLLVSSLTKLRQGGASSSAALYNEAAITLEKLAILKAWAEVYIEAMEEQCSKGSDQPKESLLSLVSPELVFLSSQWLAALKDKALLSLPPEFNSQLPHEGGAFYTPDTMDAARPYYREAWPPILHAAVLWLCEANSFESTEDLHLLFGTCMEALCGPPSTTPLSTAEACLRALKALLECPFPQEVLANDPQLSVEVCHVLYRLLLTQDSTICQTLVMEIAALVAHAHQNHLQKEKEAKLKDSKDDEASLADVGEGGETGDILPLKSIVFALMEDCLCLLLRFLPPRLLASSTTSQNGSISPSFFKAALKPITKESAKVLASCLHLLSQLPELCSPAGSTTVLPVILHLLLGVIGETEDEDIVAAALGTLSALLHSPFLENPLCQSQWIALFQSAFDRILTLPNTATDGHRKPNEEVLLSAIEIFLIHAPSEVISIPNLLYPAINLLKQSLLKVSPQVQTKCIKILRGVFSRSDSESVSIPCIHALAPRLVGLLSSLVTSHNLTPSHVPLIKEGFAAINELVEAALPSKRSQLLALFVPLLASALIDPSVINSRTPTAAQYSIHESALQQLLKVGPLYPTEFRAIVTAQPHVKRALEACCSGRRVAKPTAEGPVVASLPTSRPSIKLKTDFSNFSG